MRYQTGSHSKYKKRVLKGAVKDRLKELFRQSTQINEWTIEELNIQEDHMHMLIELKSSISVRKAVDYLKGK